MLRAAAKGWPNECKSKNIERRSERVEVLFSAQEVAFDVRQPGTLPNCGDVCEYLPCEQSPRQLCQV